MPDHFTPSRLSERLAPSGIRKLELIAKSRKDLISFGPGQPDASTFPTALISDTLCLSKTGSPQLENALQYSPSQGDPELVELLVKHMRRHGVCCDENNILITSGAQQALDLISQLLIEDGKAVLVQQVTYPGALQVFRARGAKITSIEGGGKLRAYP